MPLVAEDVNSLRGSLGLSKADFAKAVGVDVRTVARWEAGEAPPTGAAEAVLSGIKEKIMRDPTSTPTIAALVAGALAFGGLSYLIFKLLDSQPEETSRTQGTKGQDGSRRSRRKP